MNHIYRTVWNKTLNTWVAAPESARAVSKSASGGSSVVTAPRASWRGVAAAVALLWGGLAGHQAALAQVAAACDPTFAAAQAGGTVACTGLVTEAQNSSEDNLTVNLNAGATILGATTLSGTNATVNVNQGATVTGAMTLSGADATVNVNEGATVAGTVSISGANATVNVVAGGTVAEAVALSGANAKVNIAKGATVAGKMDLSTDSGHTVVHQGALVGGLDLGAGGKSDFHAVTGSVVGTAPVKGGGHADTTLHLQNTASATDTGTGAEGEGVLQAGTYTEFKKVQVHSGTWTMEAAADAVADGAALDLQGGKLVVTHDDNIHSGATIKASGGTLVMSGAAGARTVGNDIANEGGLTVEVAQANDGSTLGGVISGAGALTKTGDGALVLGGTNTYTGATNVQSGKLKAKVAGLGSTSGVSLAEGTTLDITDADSTGVNLTASVSGKGKLVKSGTEDVTLSGTNTHEGGTEVAAGKVIAAVAALGTGGVSVASGATLELDQTAAAGALAQNITGDGAVATKGTNKLTLTGTNTFKGDLTVGAGTLIGAVASLGSAEAGGITVESGATLGVYVAAGATDTLARKVSSDGAVTKIGEGTLVLGAANTYEGATTVEAGTLKSTVTNLGTGAGGVAVKEGATLEVDGAGDLTKVVSGAGKLVKSGAGALTLSGANTYTGATEVKEGTLKAAVAKLGGTDNDAEKGVVIAEGAELEIDGAGDLKKVVSGAGKLKKSGTGDLTLSGTNTHEGGTEVAEGKVTAAVAALGTGGVSVAGGATLEVDQATDATLAQAITGDGAVTKKGAGKLTLTGTNGFKGDLTVEVGTLKGAVASLGSAEAGSISVTAPAVLEVDVAADATDTLKRKVTGTGGVTKTGAGTLVFGQEPSSTNDYSGATKVEAGTLKSTVTNLGATSGISVAEGAALSVDGAGSLDKVVTGAGKLVKSGAGDLTLGAVQAYTGATEVAEGTLKSTVAHLGTTSGVSLAEGTALDITDAGASPVDLNKPLSGKGKLVKSGATTGGFTISGDNSGLEGGVDITGTGDVLAKGAAALGTGKVSVVTGATLKVEEADTKAGTLAQVIEGAGNLTKTGAGKLTLTGANTFTGDVAVEAGTLESSAAGLGEGTNEVQVSAGATLALTGGELERVVAGDGNLTKTGAGEVTLKAVNTYTGKLTVAEGTLKSEVTNLGATTGGIENNATLEITDAGDVNLDRVIGGTGKLVKSGAGVVTVAQAQTYTGATEVKAGTLKSTVANLGTTSGVNLAENAKLEITDTTAVELNKPLSGAGKLVKSGNAASVGTDIFTISGDNSGLEGGVDITGTGVVLAKGAAALGTGKVSVVTGATLKVEEADTKAGTLAQVIEGAGNLTKVGAGKLTLTGANTFTGDVAVEAGTLESSVASLGAATTDVAVSADATLALTEGDMTRKVTGAGNLTKAGAGELTLSAANDYTGKLTVAEGTLKSVVANLGATTGGIENNATLEITDAGDVNLNRVIGGTGKLVKSGAGVVTVTEAQTYTGATEVNAGVLKSTVANLGATSGVTVAQDAKLEVTGEGELAKVVGGKGGLVKSDAGTLTLAAVQAYEGATEVNAGVLKSTVANLGATSGVTVAQDAKLEVMGGGELLDVAGEGSLNLAGAQAFSVGAGKTVDVAKLNLTGTTTLLQDGGTLKANALNVNAGTTLAGVGTIAKHGADALAVTVADGAKLSAGTQAMPYGTLTIDGNLAMADGSVLEVNVNPESQEANKVAVTGTATLAGSVAHVGREVVESSDFAAGSKTYTILTAEGGVTGKFTKVDSAFMYLDASLAHGAKDVTLKLKRKTDKIAEDAATGNQRGVAEAISQLPDGHPVLAKVFLAENQAQAQQMFTELSGDTHASVATGLSLISYHGTGLSMQNLRHNLTAGLRAGAPLAQSSGTMPASAMPTSKAQPLWVELVGQWQKADDTRNAPGLRQNSTGLFIGGDTEVAGTGWRVGGSLGYTRSDSKLNTRSASADMDSVTATVYAGKSFAHGSNRINVMGGLSHSRHNVESQRVALAGLYKASYNANSTQLFGEVGYAMGQYSGFALEPYVGVSLGQLHTDAFRETGGIAALEGRSANEDLSSLTLGLHMHNDTQLAGKSLRVRTSLGLRHNVSDVEQDRQLRFAGVGNYFTVKGAPLARTTGLFKLQGELELSRNATLELGYSGEFSGKSRDQSANVKMRWGF